MVISIDGFEISLLTIVIAIGVLIVAWFVFQYLIDLAGALFRIGCFIFVILLAAGAAYYFLFLN